MINKKRKKNLNQGEFRKYIFITFETTALSYQALRNNVLQLGSNIPGIPLISTANFNSFLCKALFSSLVRRVRTKVTELLKRVVLFLLDVLLQT